jgi:hypothetical protein
MMPAAGPVAGNSPTTQRNFNQNHILSLANWAEADLFRSLMKEEAIIWIMV